MPYTPFARTKSYTDLHVGPEVVEGFLDGLPANMMVVLPKACVQAAGLDANINDKHKSKDLWIGRMRHLKRLIRAEVLKQANDPTEIRRSLLEAALSEVEQRNTMSATLPMKLADFPDEEVVRMSRAAVVIQQYWRKRFEQSTCMDTLQVFRRCVIKGCVVFVCGSTGIAGDSLRYMRLLGGMGYIVVAPDDLAGSSSLRKRQSKVIIRPDDATDYWQRNLLYLDESAKGEMVYYSSSEEFMKDPQRFDHLYNNIITVRQAEVAFTLRRLPDFMKRRGVFLFGMSEGAIVLSSFHDHMFGDMLRGRILASYSCEQNYWNYNRPEDVGIAGMTHVPTLNMMGYEDEYFGVHNSISASVAGVFEDHPPIHGHAFEAMVEHGIEWGVVAHFEGGRHNLLFTHDDVIREMLADFLERPMHACRQLPTLWSQFPHLQDQITRVKASYNNHVMYVRIRPPAMDEVTVKSRGPTEDRDIPRLLARINGLLHAINSADVEEDLTFSMDMSDIDSRASSPHGGETSGNTPLAPHRTSALSVTFKESADVVPPSRGDSGDVGVSRPVALTPLSVSARSTEDSTGLGGGRISRTASGRAFMLARMLAHTVSSQLESLPHSAPADLEVAAALQQGLHTQSNDDRLPGGGVGLLGPLLESVDKAHEGLEEAVEAGSQQSTPRNRVAFSSEEDAHTSAPASPRASALMSSGSRKQLRLGSQRTNSGGNNTLGVKPAYSHPISHAHPHQISQSHLHPVSHSHSLANLKRGGVMWSNPGTPATAMSHHRPLGAPNMDAVHNLLVTALSRDSQPGGQHDEGNDGGDFPVGDQLYTAPEHTNGVGEPHNDSEHMHGAGDDPSMLPYMKDLLVRQSSAMGDMAASASLVAQAACITAAASIASVTIIAVVAVVLARKK